MVLSIRKIGVVGGGVMGSQIGGIIALNGFEVVIKDISKEMTDKTYSKINENFNNLVTFHKNRAAKEITRIEKNDEIKLTEDQKIKLGAKLKPEFSTSMKEKALSRLKMTTDWGEFNDKDLAIEAVVEDMDVKKRIFKDLDANTPKHAILATNTSSLSITEIASATSKPGKVVGMHFFNPPITLPLVEIIPGLDTSKETLEDIMAFTASIRNHRVKMQPVKVKEVPGFLVNRILFAMLNEAFAAYEEGSASLVDIDLAMKQGTGMPMGPFELADLIGVDVLYHIQEEMRKMNGGNVMQRPVQILRKMYHAGKLGKKSGKGFYNYE